NMIMAGCFFSRFLHFPTVDGCNATFNSCLAPIVICCCIFNAILTNDHADPERNRT
ncbi:hypothetical protein L9F63_028082, partial [Diploptera punctata]